MSAIVVFYMNKRKIAVSSTKALVHYTRSWNTKTTMLGIVRSRTQQTERVLKDNNQELRKWILDLMYLGQSQLSLATSDHMLHVSKRITQVGT